MILVFALLISGCSGGETDDKKPGLGGSKSQTITYYVWGSQNEFKVVQDVVNGFKKENSGVDVKIERSTNDYFSQLRVKMGTNSGPDIFFMDVAEYAMFANKDFLLPLDDYIAKSEKIKIEDQWEINDLYRYENGKIGSGKLYALIKDWSPGFMLFYNKAHFDEQGIPYPETDNPMTWTKFMSIAKQLTKKDSSNKITRYGTVVSFDVVRHLQEWIIMAGGNFYSDDSKTLNINTPEAKKAIDFYVDLQKGDDAPARYTTEASAMVAGDQFANGTVSMVFYGRWAVPSYFENAPGLEYGFCLPPIPEGGSVKGSMASGIISHSLNAKSKNVDLAFKFLEYLQTDGQVVSAKLGFNIPGNKAVALDTFSNETDPKKKELNDFFLKYAQQDVINPIANPYISQSTLDSLVATPLVDAILGKKTSQEAIDAITKDVNKELADNID